jgi:uncharacterized membrane protein YphA (DoxX/SURF4 family)
MGKDPEPLSFREFTTMTVDSAYARNAIVPLVLRVTLGAIFVFHGVNKVTGVANDWGASWANQLWQQQVRGPQDTVNRLNGIAAQQPPEKAEEIQVIAASLQATYAREAGSMPGGLEYHLTQILVAWGELLCGLMLFIGLLTRLAAVLMIVVQLGAIYTVTWERGFSFGGGGGFEYNVALLAMCFALLIGGGGPLLSLNRLILGKVKEAQGTAPAPQPERVA